MAYNQMPKTASADPNVKLQYINGTFCYAHKTVVVSNALGVIRHLHFCDYPPDATITNLNSPEETKLSCDGKLLIPAMDNFFNCHPNFNIWAMTADSGFDDIPTYKYLFESHGILPVIALNPKNTKQNFSKPGFNQDSISTCPKDPSLPMKWDDFCKSKNRAFRNKFICAKPPNYPAANISAPAKINALLPTAEECFILIPKTTTELILLYPEIQHYWNKITDYRPIIEQVISRLKLPLQIDSIKTKNRKTIKADLFMAGAAHLIIVLLVYRMEAIDKIRSVKSIA